MTDSACALLLPLVGPRRKFPGSVWWNLTADGVCVEGGPAERTPGQPITIRRLWKDYGEDCRAVSRRFGVPVELLLACIATESMGNPLAVRLEPGYVSDDVSPRLCSFGLMQTLLATSKEATGDMGLDRAKLFIPRISIHAGAAYMRLQWRYTLYDVPLVLAAYNAGRLRESKKNRWRLVSTGDHIDRGVRWFNDAVQELAAAPPFDCVSFAAAFRPS